jgi:ankyrin repeat protein
MSPSRKLHKKKKGEDTLYVAPTPAKKNKKEETNDGPPRRSERIFLRARPPKTSTAVIPADVAPLEPKKTPNMPNCMLLFPDFFDRDPPPDSSSVDISGHSLFTLIAMHKELDKLDKDFVISCCREVDRSLINKPDKYKGFPIVWAIATAPSYLFEEFLSLGADVSYNVNHNCLTMAIKQGRKDIIESLLKMPEIIALINKKTEELPKTPLTMASAVLDSDLCVRLVNLGADVNLAGEDDRTPLMWCISYYKNSLNLPKNRINPVVELTKFYLKKGAYPDIVSATGWTALRLCVVQFNWLVMCLLLEFRPGYYLQTARGSRDINDTLEYLAKAEKQATSPSSLREARKCREVLENSEFYARRSPSAIYQVIKEGRKDPNSYLFLEYGFLPAKILEQILFEALIFNVKDISD